jgi:cytochrome P450
MTETPVRPAKAEFPMTRSGDCPFDPAVGYTELVAQDATPRVSCPVGVDAWVVTGYEDMRTVLGDSRLSSRGATSTHVMQPQELDVPPGPGNLFRHDGEEHSRLRRLLTSEFTVKRIQALRPYIQQLIDQHIDAMLAKTEPVDLVADFALPIPSLVICELLGVAYDDREHFQRQSAALVTTDTTDEEKAAAAEHLQGFIAQLVLAKTAEPTDDLLSRLIQRGNESGQPLTIPELVTLGVSLLIAGHETTANMIALSTLALLRSPDQLDALRADPSLAASAVEEMLRYLSVVQFGVFRYVTEDIPLGEETLRAGDWLVAALSAGNRDTTVFPDADKIDLKRKASAHLAFGYGAHQCLGQQLARVELQQVFSTLFQRIPTLRLAVPFEDLRFKDNALVYGLRALPVTWDQQN